MFPLLNVLTQFLVVALVVTTAVLGVAVGYFYVRSRRAEEPRTLSAGERAELQRRDAEIAAIRKRIEEMYRYQRHGSETQHALVGQQIEQMQHELQARSRQIEGLQSQLRHEMQQREASMNELRAQLTEGLRALSAPALPPAQTPSAPALPAAAPPPSPALGWTWEPVELDLSLETPPPAAPPPPEDDYLSLFEDPEPASDDDFPTFAPLEEFLSDDELLPLEQGSAPDAPQSAPGELDGLIRWASLRDDAGEEDARADAQAAGDAVTQHGLGGFAFHEPSFFGGDGHGGDGQAQEESAAYQSTSPPEDAEDLTVLPMVTEGRQARLYELGIFTIEEIARWNRDDARRAAASLGGRDSISEDAIMNEWVFAAQAILFDRYQAELQARRAAVR